MVNKTIEILRDRFEKNKHRHGGVSWSTIEDKLRKNMNLLATVEKMEKTGGEPDVVEIGDKLYFVDCSLESPKNRRSLCYDRKSRLSRKEHAPLSSAIEMATEIGIEILTGEDYRQLQSLGEIDLKTSSWVKTPKEVRDLGGAVFADRRYDRVFFYHNGAESYYASRGFRGKVKI
ncbi:hypothetical protein A2572_01905 [Candidatus Collierbacteria bacterium RIFOXYD1_FULL_40_9]|uniref:DUF4256 domain-containing protein n=1 Tax=Candidatus Collierbacteria bacterium RIFOXYD1_FULL_40_9 TaxID=1817731 RepID=A0A1F5FUA9_9BACT|nr:MAG: hypothetical protein A2572_01905 [Candidatus Collierbacteria bacterium RIFOXYD1_FULL_40_9]